jgi:hypothetical protein
VRDRAGTSRKQADDLNDDATWLRSEDVIRLSIIEDNKC